MSMVPQSYPLMVEIDNQDFCVIGWRDYGGTFRPVVVPATEPATRAFSLDPEVSWRARIPR